MFGNQNLNINSAVIKVMGIGGGGCNAVNSMIESNISSAKFYAVNTDNQALLLSKAENCIQIGAQLTKGLGAGSDPNIGESAAEESREEIAAQLEGTDLLFIAAGMGGGTGTGAASVVARIAKEMGILTIAVVTKPFSFEGKVRNENANKGIINLKKYVDTLVVIPNDKLLQYLPPQTGMLDAFKVADDMLKQGIVGIVDLIATPSLINLDFADVNTVMRNQGLAHMGIGRAKGENRIIESVRQAVSSPLLETTIEGAKSVILNVTGGKDLMLQEVSEAANLVQGIIDSSANIIFGATIDESMIDEVKITVIATGFSANKNVDDAPEVLEVKPVMEVKAEPKVADSSVLPLVLKIEEEEKRLQEESAVVEKTFEEPLPDPIIEKIEEELNSEPKPAKGRELPAFMRRLFKK